MAAKTLPLDGKKLQVALASIAHKLESGGTLRVGFLEGASYPADKNGKPGLPVATVAFWNEFGTVRSPARPFFRTTIAQQQKTWGDKLGKALAFYNYDGVQALRALGQSMRDDVEASIQRWSTPPNALRTIRRKGFNKPLVHTSVMNRSPDFELKK